MAGSRWRGSFRFEHGATMSVAALTKVQTVSDGSGFVPASCRHGIRRSREHESCGNGRFQQHGDLEKTEA